MKKIINHHGFTFIEILITTAIFSIIILSLYSAFQTGLLSYAKIDSSFEIYQSARITLNRIETDLKNCVLYKNEDSGFSGDAKTLQFFTVLDTYAGEKVNREFFRVKYELDGTILKRSVLKGLQAIKEEAEAESEEIATDIADIVFEYINKTPTLEEPFELQESWPKESIPGQKGNLPLAVKIKLNLPEAEFNKTVTIPLGK